MWKSFGKDHCNIASTQQTLRIMAKLPKITRWYYQGVIQGKEKLSPTGYGKYFILCLGFWHHPTHDPQHYICRAIQIHRICNGHSGTNSWLLCMNSIAKFRHKNQIWCWSSTLMILKLLLTKQKKHDSGHYLFLRWFSQDKLCALFVNAKVWNLFQSNCQHQFDGVEGIGR